MRQTIAQRLKASQNAAASLTTFNEIDMSSIMDFRKLYKDGVLKNEGVKLGFMSAFARASVLALKEIPAANASIEGDQIIYRDYVDLSVAVATPKGLVTPVVRNAEAMGLVDIEKAIAELGKKVCGMDRSALMLGPRQQARYRGHVGWFIHHFQRRSFRFALRYSHVS